MSPSTQTSAPELYTKLIIALADFAAFVFFVWIHVAKEPVVPAWVFVALLSILGSMLGVDIIRDVWDKR